LIMHLRTGIVRGRLAVMKRPIVLALVVMGLLAGTLPAPARAEPECCSDEAYLALLAEAREARAAGDLERALERLERAYTLSAAVSVLNNIAVVLEDLGRYAEALAVAERVAADASLPPERRPQVEAQLAALRPRAAQGHVLVAADAGVVVHLDGTPLAPAAEHAVDPGAHMIDARWPDGSAAWLPIELPAGRRTTVDLAAAVRGQALGALDLRAVRAASVTVDERAWPRTGPDAVDRLWLPPGPHGVAPPGGRVTTIVITRGEVLALQDAPRDDGPGLGPILTGALGLVATGIGVGLWLDADDQRAVLRRDMAAGGEPISGLSRASALEREADADRTQTIGAAALTGGGLALGGALVWLLLDEAPPGLVVAPRAGARRW